MAPEHHHHHHHHLRPLDCEYMMLVQYRRYRYKWYNDKYAMGQLNVGLHSCQKKNSSRMISWSSFPKPWHKPTDSSIAILQMWMNVHRDRNRNKYLIVKCWLLMKPTTGYFKMVCLQLLRACREFVFAVLPQLRVHRHRRFHRSRR